MKYIILASLVFLSSCTATRWTVVEQSALDNSDFKLIGSTEFLSVEENINPENPIFTVKLFGEETYEFSERVQVERSVQKYKPRLGFFSIGLMGAAASVYAANSDILTDSPTKSQSVALHAAAVALGTLSFLNMKPSGPPVSTGEARLLRKTGTFIQVDTVNAVPEPGSEIIFSAFYGDEEVIPRRSADFSGGTVSINLANEITPERFGDDIENQVRIEISYQGSVNNYFVPVENIFQPFIEVKTELAPLRNAPENNPDNVLIDLAAGSQLQLVEEGEEWHRVRYGNIETFLSSGDVEILWRPTEFTEQLSIVEVPFVPFGNVDIEKDIPVLYATSPARSALIVSNQNYADASLERPYAERDAKLMQAYFEQTLGFRNDKITTLYNFDSNNQVEASYNQFLNTITESTESAIVYISGRAFEQNDVIYLSPVQDIKNPAFALNLNQLLKNLASIPARQITVLADLDFSSFGPYNTQILNKLAGILTSRKEKSAIIFSSKPNEASYSYMSQASEKKYHYIFPYFTAQALREDKTILSELVNHLELNISYTSRRIHDKPQEISAFGDLNMHIINKK